MKDSAEQLGPICRRPVEQRGYSHKALSLISLREGRPLNRERRRSALSLGGTGGPRDGAYPNHPRPNNASYDIAKRSYR